MDFKAKFNKTDVLDFLKNQFLPDDFTESRQPIKLSELSFVPEKTRDIEFIGESSSLDLKLYFIQHTAESDPRVSLSRESFRIMSNLGAQRALLVFYSTDSDNYRLSLATITLAIKGAKTKREYSNPRRYSFFLGPDTKTHTPEQFLFNKVSNFEDLLERFSIEVVNKEFYSGIARKFTELVGGKRKDKSQIIDIAKPAISLPSRDMSKLESHIEAQEFAVRLIGRIVFCWFLKKKKSPNGPPLIPESILSTAAVVACDKDNYYHAILENFFFQVLNTEASERHSEFKKAPYDKIPFLNGGLFEPHDPGDFYDFDTVTACSKYLNTLKIPNEWFKGLFTILETYNFTIDENTSVDVELAVDPEMLGRIFENLLAEINPETGETARKSTGSFYTPRPIVEYMVDESLKEYLKCKTSIAEDRIAELLSYSESGTDLTDSEKEKVITALDEAKIIDPACGSGAFPMGMLQKIVLVLQKVDPDSKKWLEKLLDSFPSTTAKEMFRDKLEGEAELWNYTRKLGVIRKSIYGVDIQPIAVEISKLRFFLSLVVDDTVDDRKKNRAIEPLPNLEFKFVCANTLISLPKETGPLQNRALIKLQMEQAQLGKEFVSKLNSGKLGFLEGNQIQDRLTSLAKEIKRQTKETEELKGGYFELTAEIDKLKELREKYFVSSGRAKKKIEVLFTQTQNEIFAKTQHIDSQSMKLSQWEPFKNNSTRWFDPEWMFGLKDGFDVVIGNPPYVQIQNFSGMQQQKDWESQKYETYSKTGDIYCLFYERGYQLLKEGGILTFITSNKWMRANYGKVVRRFFINNGRISQLIDFGDSPIFENATTYTNILIWNKEYQAISPKAWDLSHVYKTDISLENMLGQQGAGDPLFSEDSFVVVKGEQTAIKRKIEEVGVPLKDWEISINFGIKTGLNEAFIIDGNKKDELIRKDRNSANIIKPILRGRDIKRYKAEFSDLWLINTHNGYTDKHGHRIAPIAVKKDYPAIWEHLNKFNAATDMQLEKRSDQGDHWSNLRSCAYFDEIEKEKIFYPEIVFDSAFYFDVKAFYPEATTFIITGERIKYLTALLNSRLLTYAFKTFYAGGDLRGSTFRYKKVFLELLPVPKIAPEAQLPFEILVDCILFCKERNLDQESGLLESVIDGLVYDLYFTKEMKAAHCYITDRISEIVKPFKKNDTVAFKTEYVTKLCEFCRKDTIIYHGLIHRRTVKPVQVIEGEKE